MSQEKIPTFLGKTGKVVFAKWRDIIEARTGWKPEFLEQVALAAGQYELYVTAVSYTHLTLPTSDLV